MNHFTSIEQSKHLLELGLKAETADACYDVGDGQTKAHIECENFTSYFTNDEFPELKDRYIPCWSVGALIQAIDKPLQITYFRTESGNYYEVMNLKLHKAREESLIDALYKYLTEPITKWNI